VRRVPVGVSSLPAGLGLCFCYHLLPANRLNAPPALCAC
jgi:hypothetical protein